MTELAAEVTKFLTEELGVDTNVEPTDQLADLADSLEVVGIAVEAEERFGVEITDDDLEKINTIGDFIALIETKKAA